jgi:hypothetical protein
MPTYKDQKIIFIVAPQKFTLSLTGLMPSTVHHVYFERQKIAASKLKPQSGNLGDDITTDENGQVTIEFYYDTGLPAAATTYAYFQELRSSVAGVKHIAVCSTNVDSLSSDFQSSALSYAESSISVEIYNPTEAEFTTGFSER